MSCSCEGTGSEADPLVKRPAESRLYDIDFRDLLLAGGALTGTPTAAQLLIDGSGSVTLGGTSVSGTKAQVRISAGSDGGLHKITLTATDDAASPNTLQECFYLRIEDC